MKTMMFYVELKSSIPPQLILRKIRFAKQNEQWCSAIIVETNEALGKKQLTFGEGG